MTQGKEEMYHDENDAEGDINLDHVNRRSRNRVDYLLRVYLEHVSKHAHIQQLFC